MAQELRGKLYEYLTGLAREGRTTTYAQAASHIGLDIRRAADANELAALLRSISETEHQEGRPLLSAICFMAGARRPGLPFFELAKSLGLMKQTEDPRGFVDEEIRRVRDHWGSAPA
jgi:hypothetical protein